MFTDSFGSFIPSETVSQNQFLCPKFRDVFYKVNFGWLVILQHCVSFRICFRVIKASPELKYSVEFEIKFFDILPVWQVISKVYMPEKNRCNKF